eukprot:NODE_182_length_3018_cov_62.235924_g168_i0.p1 GENE.NODE_182_length_3018_cov_62.235924_g168_i0~~NODE_182_length_3018_cov_62.235924_g168_i0.p1  ORF type:complete len:364 (+),score=52.90 NODE_182_length_3018_cov_62.235924_g168_i0:1792-2883(+)
MLESLEEQFKEKSTVLTTQIERFETFHACMESAIARARSSIDLPGAARLLLSKKEIVDTLSGINPRLDIEHSGKLLFRMSTDELLKAVGNAGVVTTCRRVTAFGPGLVQASGSTSSFVVDAPSVNSNSILLHITVQDAAGNILFDYDTEPVPRDEFPGLESRGSNHSSGFKVIKSTSRATNDESSSSTSGGVRFQVSFPTPESDYVVGIYCDGSEIVGSPFTVEHRPEFALVSVVERGKVAGYDVILPQDLQSHVGDELAKYWAINGGSFAVFPRNIDFKLPDECVQLLVGRSSLAQVRVHRNTICNGIKVNVPKVGTTKRQMIKHFHTFASKHHENVDQVLLDEEYGQPGCFLICKASAFEQ